MMQHPLPIRKIFHQCHRGTNKLQTGFSVIELLVGLVIFAIVLGAVFGLLEVGRSGRLNTNMRAEALQNARIALNTVGRDIINSGVGYPNVGALVPDNEVATLFGGTADADTTLDFVTPIYARDNTGSVNGTATDQITIAFIDDAFNNSISIPINGIASDGSQLTIQTSGGYSNAPCQVGDIYLIGGQTSAAALGMLTGKAGTDRLNFQSGAADPLNLNQPGAGSAIKQIALPGSLQRITLAKYYVVDEDGTGSNTGTLMRDVYGGATGWTAQPLAFGVENFQVQYIMKDGTVADAPASDQMVNIRQVRVSITVRSPDIDPKTNQPFRTSLTATYSARNLDYEKF
ncbi:MAG: PilW family protein [Acidobacteriota bacterium]